MVCEELRVCRCQRPEKRCRAAVELTAATLQKGLIRRISNQRMPERKDRIDLAPRLLKDATLYQSGEVRPKARLCNPRHDPQEGQGGLIPDHCRDLCDM